MNDVLLWIIAMTFINGLLAFAGAGLDIIFKRNIKKILIILVSFTTGALIGGALFHFIPEALVTLDIVYTFFLVIVGFFVFFVLEKFLYWHHHHDEECEEHPFTYLIIWGDALHNFIDGLIIASSFLISIPFGIITSILIIAHELPQEIGDYAVLIYGGMKKKKALMYNFLSQLTAVIGGIMGFFFLGAEKYAIGLLPIAAGGFMYIAIADLIPEIFNEKNKKKMVINILAIIIGLALLISAKFLAE